MTRQDVQGGPYLHISLTSQGVHNIGYGFRQRVAMYPGNVGEYHHGTQVRSYI